jgi:hypothetical protein
VAHGKRMTSGTPDSWQAQGAQLGPGEGLRVRAGLSPSSLSRGAPPSVRSGVPTFPEGGQPWIAELFLRR